MHGGRALCMVVRLFLIKYNKYVVKLYKTDFLFPRGPTRGHSVYCILAGVLQSSFSGQPQLIVKSVVSGWLRRARKFHVKI